MFLDKKISAVPFDTPVPEYLSMLPVGEGDTATMWLNAACAYDCQRGVQPPCVHKHILHLYNACPTSSFSAITKRCSYGSSASCPRMHCFTSLVKREVWWDAAWLVFLLLHHISWNTGRWLGDPRPASCSTSQCKSFWLNLSFPVWLSAFHICSVARRK